MVPDDRDKLWSDPPDVPFQYLLTAQEDVTGPPRLGRVPTYGVDAADKSNNYLTPAVFIDIPTAMASNPIQNGHFVHSNTTAPEHPGMMAMFSLKGKTAIVTGAGAGIGLHVAHGLAEAGANVAMWYNTNAKCPERAAEIASKYGVQCEFGLYSIFIQGQSI